MALKLTYDYIKSNTNKMRITKSKIKKINYQNKYYLILLKLRPNIKDTKVNIIQIRKAHPN